MTVNQPEILITVEEAARRLALSEREVYRMGRKGFFKIVHTGSHGGAARVRESDLNGYIRSLGQSFFPS